MQVASDPELAGARPGRLAPAFGMIELDGDTPAGGLGAGVVHVVSALSGAQPCLLAARAFAAGFCSRARGAAFWIGRRQDLFFPPPEALVGAGTALEVLDPDAAKAKVSALLRACCDRLTAEGVVVVEAPALQDGRMSRPLLRASSRSAVVVLSSRFLPPEAAAQLQSQGVRRVWRWRVGVAGADDGGTGESGAEAVGGPDWVLERHGEASVRRLFVRPCDGRGRLGPALRPVARGGRSEIVRRFMAQSRT